jgi:signal transduction histidine kinase/CheY-like chemotaxis protein
MRLRSGLLMLVLATAVPLVAFAVLASALVVKHTQDNYAIAVKDRNRAFMSAVDAELKGAIVTLQALTASRALAEDDLPRFHQSMIAVLDTQPSWFNVLLLSADGEQLVNAAAPWGAQLAEAPAQPQSFQAVLRTGGPAVGSVIAQGGPFVKRPGIPVRVPVMRHGKLAYVLTALIKPEVFERLIQQQRLPAGWVSGLVDSEGQFIARVPAKPVGSRASSEYLEHVRTSPEGWYRGQTVEGLDTYTAHVTSELSGWSVGFAIPTKLVLGGAQRAAWLMGGGVVLSLALAVAIALWLGRRISGPIAELSSAAHGLGSSAAPIKVRTPIRELRELARALNDASRAIRERAEALSRADRNKSEFLAMLSHELRNPLAPLVNGLALLKARGDKDSATELAMMERQIRQLARLIDDLLDISRIDRGKLELRRERVGADAIVRSAVEIARPNIEHRNHELVLRFPGTPVYLDADPVRMAQVLSNLLNNAAKFTAPGGRIEVSLKAEGEEVVICIADNGIGLAQEDTERIFDMFVQLDSSRSQAAGGLGLGLTLARSIVERHRGRIWAESEGPEKGTRFSIRLPLAPAPKGKPQLRQVRDGDASGRRILVVDDNVDAATSLASVLELSGHEVRTAFGGLEALAAAEEFQPDCVVLDLNLPGIDGVEVGRRLRETAWGRTASLIAMTGMGLPADVARTREAGFDHHMTKPVEPRQVLDLVAAHR